MEGKGRQGKGGKGREERRNRREERIRQNSGEKSNRERDFLIPALRSVRSSEAISSSAPSSEDRYADSLLILLLCQSFPSQSQKLSQNSNGKH